MAESSPPPRRRFLPEPVETTSRSSKRPHPGSSDQVSPTDDSGQDTTNSTQPTTKPRRFQPQPIEESVRSSRKKKVEGADRISSPPEDPSVPTEGGPQTTRRRFAPEPVETSSRTSRRKFAPEPVEVTSRSSKDKPKDGQESTPADRPRRRFLPEPVETTTTTRRRRKTSDSNDSPPESASEASSKVSSRKSSGTRKFTPELIETAKGQFRQGKRENSLDSPRKVLSPQKSHTSDSVDAPESRFSAAALAKKHYEQRRRHSYCVPNLPDIESDSSGEDSPGTATKSCDSSDNERHRLEDIDEGEDASYMDYVYSLADRQKLQEQAMAAYINEVPHQPFAHFAAEEDDDDDDPHGVLSGQEGVDPKTFRRSSQDELDIELSSMRKHHEQLERAKRELAQDTAGASRFSAAALAARHHLQLGQSKQPQPEHVEPRKPKEETGELARMRTAASPPMAGGDIVYPFTVSPKMTRCDVDQAPRPRRADSDDEPKVQPRAPVLWTANVTITNKTVAGLWMGMCQQEAGDQTRPATPIKSGLQTPAFEGPNPFDAGNGLWGGGKTPSRLQAPKPWHGMQHLSVTPTKPADNKDEFINSIDQKLQVEKQIDEEFPNRVITQIYNYLSLGYPSLARPFDEELSKISRITVDDLRKDDKTAQNNAKGYVGAPESEGNWHEDEQGALQGCRRWEALRLYIREWARQSPNFANEMLTRPGNGRTTTGLRRNEAWGTTVRKGSWAN